MSTGSTLAPPGALGKGARVVVTGTAAGGGGGGGRHAAATNATANTARVSRTREKRERRDKLRTMPAIQHMCGATVETGSFWRRRRPCRTLLQGASGRFRALQGAPTPRKNTTA